MNDHTEDFAAGYVASLKAQRDELLAAAEEALSFLKKGAPGWGVSKYVLNAAIHKARDAIAKEGDGK